MISTLVDDINMTPCPDATVWWLGGSGFAVKYQSIVFYVDPYVPPGMSAGEITNADMILRTHVDETAPDPTPEILKASGKARVLLPKSNAENLNVRGVGYDRMTTTDADLRVEYFKSGVYGRVYSVPSCRQSLDWTPLGGYPYLGYLIRFGDCTIYHPGVSVPYTGLADRLRPYNVTLALLPVGDSSYTPAQAGQLAEEIQAAWVAPMPEKDEAVAAFIDHMLGHRPAQRFKLFVPGEAWTVGDDGEV